MRPIQISDLTPTELCAVAEAAGIREIYPIGSIVISIPNKYSVPPVQHPPIQVPPIVSGSAVPPGESTQSKTDEVDCINKCSVPSQSHGILQYQRSIIPASAVGPCQFT